MDIVVFCVVKHVCIIFISIYSNDIQLSIFCEGFDLTSVRSSMTFLHIGVDLSRHHSGTSGIDDTR